MGGEPNEARVVAEVPKGLLVAGQWVDAGDGATFDVLDPSTAEVLCAVADATPEEGRRALDAAAGAGVLVVLLGWLHRQRP